MIQSANHLAAAYNQAETGQDAHKHHNLIYADHGMDVGSRWLIWEFLLISSFMYNRLEFTLVLEFCCCCCKQQQQQNIHWTAALWWQCLIDESGERRIARLVYADVNHNVGEVGIHPLAGRQSIAGHQHIHTHAKLHIDINLSHLLNQASFSNNLNTIELTTPSLGNLKVVFNIVQQ